MNTSPIPTDHVPIVGSAQTTLPSQRVETANLNLPPGYELLGALGRGGMGVVVRALQTKLDRVVALKLILAGPLASGTETRRFFVEAQAQASVQHPNIVQVYEIGEHAGQPFLALEYCPRGCLANLLTGQPLPVSTALNYFVSLINGVAAAHAANLVHRDLKPENVLIATDGTLKLSDFGLVKRLDADDSLTRTGMAVGTPYYMAPEQTRANTKLGPACDLWALGVLLYEFITGKMPFSGGDVMELMRSINRDDPVPPRRIQSTIPRDVETICLKCLHKDPTRRYASAQALLADVQRFQRGEPILARPIGWGERAIKWIRRHPLASVIGLAFVALVGVTLAFSVAWAVAADATRRQAERDRLTAEIHLARSMLEQAILHCANGEHDLTFSPAPLPQPGTHHSIRGIEVHHGLLRLAQAAQQVAKTAQHPGAAPPELADLDSAIRHNWAWWQTQVPTRPIAAFPHANWIWDVAFSRSGQYAGTISHDGTAQVWDTTTSQRVGAPLPVGGKGWWIAFAPDEQHVLTVTNLEQLRGTLQRWHINSGQPAGPAIPVTITNAAFNAVVRSDGAVWTQTALSELRCLDAATGTDVGPKLRVPIPLRALTASADGRTLFGLLHDGQLRRWDAVTGQTGAALPRVPAPAGPWEPTLHVTADGRHLYANGEPGNVFAVDLSTGQALPPLAFPGVVRRVASSRDGTWAIAVGYRGVPEQNQVVGAFAVWERATGEIRQTSEMGWPLWSVVVLGDDTTAVLTTESGTAAAYSVLDQQLVSLTAGRLGHPGSTRTLAVHPDGQRVLLSSSQVDTCAPFYQVERRAPRTFLPRPYQPPEALAFPPDGEHLLAAHPEGLHLWHLTGTPRSVRFLPMPGNWRYQALSANLQRLLVWAELGDPTVHNRNQPNWSAQIWDVTNGTRLATLPNTHPFHFATWAPDGQWFLAGGAAPSDEPHLPRRLPHIFDGTTGEPRVRIPDQPPMPGFAHDLVAIAPTGKHLLTGCRLRSRGLALWEVGRWEQPVWTLRPDEAITGALFTADGQGVSVHSVLEQWRTWSIADGTQARLPLQEPALQTWAYDPSGRWLAIGVPRGVQIWDVRVGVRVGPVWRTPAPVCALAWHPRAPILATASKSGHLSVIPLPLAPTESAAHLQAWTQALTQLVPDAEQVRRLPLEQLAPQWAALAQFGPIPLVRQPTLAVPGVALPPLFPAAERLPMLPRE
jgi:WD40 repeat protein